LKYLVNYEHLAKERTLTGRFTDLDKLNLVYLLMDFHSCPGPSCLKLKVTKRDSKLIIPLVNLNP